jgi:hypothetical protein
MVASGGFSGAWIKSAMVTTQYPNLGIKRQRYVECKNPMPAPMADIDLGLSMGSLVVVQVDREEDRAFEDEDGHWVVLVKKEGNDYQMWDPWQKNGAPATLVGRYGFGSKKPEEIIQAAIWHGTGDMPKAEDKPATPPAQSTPPPAQSTPPPASPAPSAGKLMVKTTKDGVSFRSAPRTGNDTLIKTMPTGTMLEVIESGTPANKIGVQDQWLQVKASDGVQGYVAAWFVVKA